MSDQNTRPDRDGPVEDETVVAKQARAGNVPLRDDRVEDVGVRANEPVHYERDADAVPPRGDRGENVGPDEPIRFEENEAVPPREAESPARAPILATAMFLPVVIITIIALILIIWFLAF